MKSMNHTRNITIDIVRSVCMLCIILAHVQPPSWVFTLRSFDVVGLVIVSSMCMKKSNNVKEYINSIKGRMRRLLIPTYTAILVVLIATFLACVVCNIPYLYSISDILSSIILVDGIGYVWIVREFMIIAFLSPILFRISEIKESILYLVFCVTMFAIKILCSYVEFNGVVGNLLLYYGIYSFGYCFIAILGIRFIHYTMHKRYNLIAVSLISLIIYKTTTKILWGDSLITFEKHPPMIDWILYGVCITTTCFILGDKLKKVIGDKSTAAISWFSRNSFLVYFMHIFVLKFFDFISIARGKEFDSNWLLKYLVVLVASISMSLVYLKIKRLLFDKIYCRS